MIIKIISAAVIVIMGAIFIYREFLNIKEGEENDFSPNFKRDNGNE
jgi:hypothetical protein